jgi:hypothetical protein
LIEARTETLTFGSSQALSPRVTNDARLNWSRSLGGTNYVLDDFGGAVVPSDAALFPGYPAGVGRFVRFNPRDVPLLVAGYVSRNRLTQWNFVEGVSLVHGRHTLQFGVDWRRVDTTPDYPGGIIYAQWSNFTGIGVPDAAGAFRSGTALSGILASCSVTTGYRASLRFVNFSAYAQDTLRVSDRLTLTFGVRWEVNPAVRGADGTIVYTVDNQDQPAQITLAPPDTPLYETRYRNVAPRFGITYRLRGTPGNETVLRGGAGTFYDLGSGVTAGVASGWPNYSSRRTGAVPYPLASNLTGLLPFSAALPATEMVVADRNLELPRTHQWNVAVEQAFGPTQSISITYAGAVGRKLLRNEYTFAPNNDFSSLLTVRNSATSDFHAMQLRYQRRLSRGLQALASYSWSHSIDLGSNDAQWGNIPLDRYDPTRDRGSSDFDVRHALSAAVTWNLPAPGSRAARRALSGFALDTLLTARSAAPVDLIGGVAYLQYLVNTRPDLVPNQPLYLYGANIPGGRRLNPAAFQPTPSDDFGSAIGQGTLGRNVLRGFNLSQLDIAIRREFPLHEKARLQFRAEAFNILNHPNFGRPVADRASPLFGLSTQMLGRSIGSGGPTAGLAPLYQVGGPRSLQLALKLVF